MPLRKERPAASRHQGLLGVHQQAAFADAKANNRSGLGTQTAYKFPAGRMTKKVGANV